MRRVAYVQQCERQRDVLGDRKIWQHVKRLEHETHALAAKRRSRVVVERGDVDAVDDNATGIDQLEPGDDVEQRRFADSRRAYDRDVLAARDLEREVGENVPRRGRRKRLRDRAQLDDGRRANRVQSLVLPSMRAPG